jgi:hypothetical protein
MIIRSIVSRHGEAHYALMLPIDANIVFQAVESDQVSGETRADGFHQK